MFRTVLAFLYIAGTVLGQDNAKYNITTGYQDPDGVHRRSVVKREASRFVEDGLPCSPESTDCFGDTSYCQKSPVDGLYRCLPATKGVDYCDIQPLISKCDFDGYDKNTPPAMALTGGSTTVKVKMYLRNIYKYRDTGLYNLDLYVKQFWNDPRLVPKDGRLAIYHRKEQVDAIWQPDFYFTTAIQTYRQELLTPNLSLRIYRSGLIRLSQRVQVVIACTREACVVPIESYGTIRALMNLTWDDAAPPLSYDSTIADQVVGVNTSYCVDDALNANGRTYPCLVATFHLASGLRKFMPDVNVSTQQPQRADAAAAGPGVGQPQVADQSSSTQQALNADPATVVQPQSTDAASTNAQQPSSADATTVPV